MINLSDPNPKDLKFDCKNTSDYETIIINTYPTWIERFCQSLDNANRSKNIFKKVYYLLKAAKVLSRRK